MIRHSALLKLKTSPERMRRIASIECASRVGSGQLPQLNYRAKMKPAPTVNPFGYGDTSAADGIPWKEWVAMEAEKLRISSRAMFNRLYRGKHPMPPVRRVNKRRIFVMVPKQLSLFS